MSASRTAVLIAVLLLVLTLSDARLRVKPELHPERQRLKGRRIYDALSLIGGGASHNNNGDGPGKPLELATEDEIAVDAIEGAEMFEQDEIEEEEEDYEDEDDDKDDNDDDLRDDARDGHDGRRMDSSGGDDDDDDDAGGTVEKADDDDRDAMSLNHDSVGDENERPAEGDDDAALLRKKLKEEWFRHVRVPVAAAAGTGAEAAAMADGVSGPWSGPRPTDAAAAASLTVVVAGEAPGQGGSNRAVRARHLLYAKLLAELQSSPYDVNGDKRWLEQDVALKLLGTADYAHYPQKRVHTRNLPRARRGARRGLRLCIPSGTHAFQESLATALSDRAGSYMISLGDESFEVIR